jgi:flagellar biosynthesis/type III secretory pathway M-ring protein FliF/YscJ
MRLRARVERALADKIRGFFAGMQIESVVVVSARLELDRIKERMLELDPEGRGDIVVNEERSSGPARRAASPESAATANAPAALPEVTSRARSETQYRKTESIISYVQREIRRSAKGLVDVSASVVVFDRLVQRDGVWQYDTSVKDHLDDYKALVARALGVSGDQARQKIEVKYLPSPWTSPPPLEEPARGTAWGYAAFAAAGVALALVVLGTLRIAAGRHRNEPAADARPATPSDRPQAPTVGPLRDEVARIVGEDLERSAAILGRWLAKES